MLAFRLKIRDFFLEGAARNSGQIETWIQNGLTWSGQIMTRAIIRKALVMWRLSKVWLIFCFLVVSEAIFTVTVPAFKLDPLVEGVFFNDLEIFKGPLAQGSTLGVIKAYPSTLHLNTWLLISGMFILPWRAPNPYIMCCPLTFNQSPGDCFSCSPMLLISFLPISLIVDEN